MNRACYLTLNIMVVAAFMLPTYPRAIGENLRKEAQAKMEKAALLRQKLTKKDLLAASRLLQESARLFRAAGLPGNAAGPYLQAGDIYAMQSMYDLALGAYSQAFELSGQQLDLRCMVLSHAARTYATMGKSAEAFDYSKRASNLCKPTSSPAIRAEILESWGEAYFWLGDYSNAISQLCEAQHFFEEAKDDDGLASATLILAYIHAKDDPAEALRLGQDALRIWSANRNHYGIARAHSALAFITSLAGGFETARCHCDQALPTFQAIGDRDSQGVILNIMGSVGRKAGDAEASLEHYQRARAMFVKVKDKLGEADAITGIAAALSSMGHYPQLLPLYTQKRRLAQEAGNRAVAASALADIAGVYERQHQYGKAEQFYYRSRGAYHAAGHDIGEGTVLMLLSHLQAEQGKDEEAISKFKDALTLKEKTSEVEDQAKINYELARIYLRLGQLAEAQASIEKTIAIIESQRLQIAKFDSRAIYFAAVHCYYSLYIHVLMTLHAQHPEQGFAQRAFEASERSKVRSLLDLLTATSQNSPCDELVRKQLDPAEAASDYANVNAAAVSIPVLTLQQVQAEIVDDRTALVEYALGDEKSYVWLVTQKQIISHELPSSGQIGKLAKAFISGLSPPQSRQNETVSEYRERVEAASQDYQLHAPELSRLLVGQLSLPAETRLLIVPDASLQNVPFAALPLPRAQQRDTVLLSQHEIVVLPSASVLSSLRRAAAKRPPPTSGAVVFADPVFEQRYLGANAGPKPAEHPSALQRALHDVQGSSHIPPLPGSHKEAQAIREILGADNVFLAQQFNATRQSALSGLLANYRIVHFATHGLLDAKHPEMSGLILSLVTKQGKRQDGYLRLSDIYNLKLSADLVVLSSCESALGKELESEGIIGLPRGFLYAGARSVIASLWKVDDHATVVFMKHLYRQIKQRDPPGTALRRAQLEMANDPLYSKPYYWAAFVLQGDYK